MFKSTVCATAVFALLSASTSLAQTFEPRIGFRNDHSLADPTPNVPPVMPFGGFETLNFNVLFGAFNAQGFTNRGMFNFIGTITVSDPAGAGTISPRSSGAIVAPYSFGNVFANPNPTTITFDANRGAGSVDNIPWNFGDPAPENVYTYPAFGPGGASGAPDTYHPGFRFHFDINDFAARNVTVTVTGTMQAITDWFVTTEQEPEDGFPGFQNLLPAGFIQMPVSQSFSIFIPAPSAAALLGLGGLLLGSRRRR